MYKKSISLFLSVFIIGLLTTPVAVQAASLHAVLVGDTADIDIGASIVQDLNNMTTEINKISKTTNLKLDLQVIQGKETSVATLEKAINTIDVAEDDVVLMYFSMHGFRTPLKTSPWPNLYFSIENVGLDMDEVTRSILEKNPRLLIVLTDTCNTLVSESAFKLMALNEVQGRNVDLKGTESENYKRLFLKTSGLIQASGCIPGQESWSNKNLGGFWTVSFLKSFKNVVQRGPKANWEKVFDDTATQILQLIKQYRLKDKQQAQYELNITVQE
jgi:hypothetical protein